MLLWLVRTHKCCPLMQACEISSYNYSLLQTPSFLQICILSFRILGIQGKAEANIWENSRADQWKLEPNWGFSPAREFSQALPRFSPGYEGTENMFYFFYKIIVFRLNNEKGGIRSAYVKLYFILEAVNSHNLDAANTTAHTCWLTKTHALSKLFLRRVGATSE